MRKVYSLLSSLALLLSLPALAAPLAEKAVAPKEKDKQASENLSKDSVKAKKEAGKIDVPICRGGGG